MLGDIRLNLFDTAGVREVGEDGDAIEAEGIRRSWKKMEEAGLVLAVFDAGQPILPEDVSIAQKCAGRPAIAILNKQDTATEVFNKDVEKIAPYFRQVLPLCAKEPTSREILSGAVADLLGTACLDPTAAALCSERQLAAATAARDAITEAITSQRNGFGLDAAGVCLEDALHALYELTGEDATEAVIEEVFSRFCVGK